MLSAFFDITLSFFYFKNRNNPENLTAVLQKGVILESKFYMLNMIWQNATSDDLLASKMFYNLFLCHMKWNLNVRLLSKKGGITCRFLFD